MTHLPYRTGLVTIRAFLRRICTIAAKYRVLWTSFMTTEQIEKFDALVALCEEIIEIIDILRNA